MQAELAARVLDLAVNIQRVPAPTFKEARRAELLRSLFVELGAADVTSDPAGNVLACIPGEGSARPVVVSAHLDTVFEEVGEPPSSLQAGQLVAPGIGDNALGLASLFGLVWALRQKEARLPGDLWLVANVCEEGMGDLMGMRAVVERFGDAPLAYLVLEGMSLEHIYHQGLGALRFTLTAHTAGGHSWVDYGKPSAVHELALLVSRLTAWKLPEAPRATLNVGVMRGGTSVNTIACEAQAEVDLRSESPEALEALGRSLYDLVAGANRPGVQVTASVVGRRPAGGISSDHPLVVLTKRCLEAQGVRAIPAAGSTDASLPLSLGLPAVCVGITTGGGAHTIGEFIHTQPVAQGLAALVMLVESVYRELSTPHTTGSGRAE